MHPAEINILYLAKYAPANIGCSIPDGILDKSYAEYHHKVYRELITCFPKTVSSDNPAIMLSECLCYDFIFSLYNRIPFRNSEVFVSSVAEFHHIPYLGATPNIRALAEDKHLAKMMAKYAEIPTPDWCVYNIGDVVKRPSFSPPYFVKPRFGATSQGITEKSVCQTWNKAKEEIVTLQESGFDVILEKQIDGVYHTSPILHNFGESILLPCIAQYSTHKHGVVTYEQKRKMEPGLNREVVTDQKVNQLIQSYSLKMYQLVQPLDYTRFDYILENDTGVPYFLEFNVCCNLGEHSTISQSASSLGITYNQLISNIVYSSIYRARLINETFGKKL